MQSELIDALKGVGIKKGDTVFSCINMPDVYKQKEKLENESLFNIILDAILEVIDSEGTLLTPIYSYSFYRGEIFDPFKTPSNFGEFSEKFRKCKGVKRSLDPIFSVGGIGPMVDALFLDLPKNCFGNDCIYDRLSQIDAKVCIIGARLSSIAAIQHIEQIVGLPYRYIKLFSGYIKRDGKLVKENWLCNVRIQGEFSNPNYTQLEKDAKDMNKYFVTTIELGEVGAIKFQDLFELCKTKLNTDPWYLVQGPACDPVEHEKKRIGVKKFDIHLSKNATMKEMTEKLWRLPRDIVSDGYDAALEALSSQIPMTIHQYPTGTECFTWIIPEKWTCHEAYLETQDGKRIFSYCDNPLHVVSYSLPFKGKINQEELFKHLSVHPRLPEAIPFVFKYYERDWGLCCSENLKKTLTDNTYRVVINSDFSFGTLKVGEVIAIGESEESFVLCAHLCHPGQVNDDLSGVVVGIDAMRSLLKRKRLRYTYRFIIVPETIGSAAYLSHNEHLIPKMIGGLFLEMLCTKHPHALQRSLPGNTQLDKCIEIIVRDYDPDAWVGNFLEVILNDERMFNAPGIQVPMLSLSRVLQPEKQFPYQEYHSSLDTPENADFRNLEDSRDLVLKIIDALEQNRIPRSRFKGELFCSRFDKIDYATMNRDIFKVIFYMNNQRTIADIAKATGMNFTKVKEILDILEAERLIEWS
jgi:aminopeptidase-like protein/aminoglycoside N3'-acetyltransferase